MTDEEYIFRCDSTEKKRTARGAHNKRTHNGKGGRVKFPSDYMTKKEREKMNGEARSFQLNKPMTWNEYTQLPFDLKGEYLKNITGTFNPTTKALGAMLGVSDETARQELLKHDITRQRGGQPGRIRDAAFIKWLNGENGTPEVAIAEEPETPAAPNKREKITEHSPATGELTFTKTTAQDAFNAVYPLLNLTAIKTITISWEVESEQATV